jgi:hypothetical protein
MWVGYLSHKKILEGYSEEGRQFKELRSVYTIAQNTERAPGVKGIKSVKARNFATLRSVQICSVLFRSQCSACIEVLLWNPDGRAWFGCGAC